MATGQSSELNTTTYAFFSPRSFSECDAKRKSLNVKSGAWAPIARVRRLVDGGRILGGIRGQDDYPSTSNAKTQHHGVRNISLSLRIDPEP